MKCERIKNLFGIFRTLDIVASSDGNKPNSNAEYAVGIMKFRGEGTKKDVEAAREMFETQNDNPAALVGLAVYHLQYNIDYPKAIELLEKAAKTKFTKYIDQNWTN